MPGRREAIAFAAVGIAAAIGGALAGVFGAQSRSGAADLLSLKLPDLNGAPQSLRQWSGRVLLCNFWATWCAPCVEEMPRLVDVQRLYRDKGLQVVGIG